MDSLDELPDWARATLDEHRARSARSRCTRREQFEDAATYDNLWNATQKELLRRGRIHGYYRMYWGKKILEWSAIAGRGARHHDPPARPLRPRRARSQHLHEHSLVLRPARPAVAASAPIYGTIRSMSRAGMERKTDVEPRNPGNRGNSVKITISGASGLIGRPGAQDACG